MDLNWPSNMLENNNLWEDMTWHLVVIWYICTVHIKLEMSKSEGTWFLVGHFSIPFSLMVRHMVFLFGFCPVIGCYICLWSAHESIALCGCNGTVMDMYFAILLLYRDASSTRSKVVLNSLFWTTKCVLNREMCPCFEETFKQGVSTIIIVHVTFYG